MAKAPRIKSAGPSPYNKTGPGITKIPEPVIVEMGRIELPSDVVLPGLLRAQFAVEFLCSSRHANKRLIRAQLPKLCRSFR